MVAFKWLCFEEAFIYAFMFVFFFFFFFFKRVNRVQTRHSVDREGLMSEFSEFEVGRHHRQLIETRRAAIELIGGCG